jgi:ATP-dependent DNA ligase
MSVETVVENLAPIYANNSHGREKVWSSRIITNTEGHGIYEIEHGQTGGKMQLTRRVFTEGKNLGRANATTPLQQCTNELRKKWADKQNKEGYAPRGTISAAAEENSAPAAAAAPSTIYPMLAQKYEPTKKNTRIEFPCFVQPKLDGLRCVVYLGADGKIVTQSRTGGQFDHLSHIKNCAQLRAIFEKYPRLVLDGELYTRDIPFESLAGLIKKKKVSAEDLKQLECVGYHIYDCICLENPAATFYERNELLRGLAAAAAHPIHFVETAFITSADFRAHFQKYIEDGYEGAMLRNRNSPYKQNNRSADLQKYKEFQEEEYTIVDFTQGAGRDEGTIIWVCETPSGERFSVRPRGSVEYRRDLFENGREYLGAKLTVIFQELSTFGVPRFPVGKCVRIDC